MMIPCFVLVYHDAEMTRMCLENLASDPRLRLMVIQNGSENTREVREAIYSVNEMMRPDQDFWYKEHVHNIGSLAMSKAILECGRLPSFSIVTDGDVLMDDIGAVIDEQIKLLQSYQQLLCVGPRIRMDNLPVASFPEAVNWVPEFEDRGDYLRGPGPHHFLMFRGPELHQTAMELGALGRSWLDTEIALYAKAIGMEFAILKNHWHRHLGWDAYADREHPYTKERLRRSLDETWGPR